MKTTCRFAVLCAAVLFAGAPLPAQGPLIIGPKDERYQRPLLWISAEAVADAEQVINFDLLDSSFLQGHVEKQRRSLGTHRTGQKPPTGKKPHIAVIPRSACGSELGQVGDAEEKPSDTAANLRIYSRSIIRGTISTIDLGFGFGMPSSLLGVLVSEVVEGPIPRSPVYVEYPVAHFRIGPFSFCNMNPGFEPRPGDEILFFDYSGPVGRDGVLYAPGLRHFAFQSQHGDLILPPQLKDDPDLQGVRTLDDVVGRLAPPGTWGGSIKQRPLHSQD